MKRFMMTTALVALTSTPMMATAQTGGVLIIDPQYQTSPGMEIMVSNLMGKTVYIAGRGADPNMDLMDITDVPSTWADAADVTDIMVDANGEVRSIVLDAGGFLGLGETEKVVRLENLKFVADGDDEGEYFVLYTGSKQLLDDSEDYDSTMMEQDGYRSAMGAGEPVTDGNNMTSTDNLITAPMDRATLTKASLMNVTTAELDGTAIYGSSDERVGEIGEMVFAEGGMIDKVIVDVGGFLGLGEHHVAMNLSEIDLMQQENGTLVGYVSMTEEQLEGLEEWRQID